MLIMIHYHIGRKKNETLPWPPLKLFNIISLLHSSVPLHASIPVTRVAIEMHDEFRTRVETGEITSSSSFTVDDS